MRTLLKLLALVVVLVAAGFVGAGIHSAFDDAKEVFKQRHPTPTLTENQAVGLGKTYLQTDSTGVSQVTCLNRGGSAEAQILAQSSFVGVYYDSGVWVVDNGLCTVTIDDNTGRVVGPVEERNGP